jgi:hypothetical protein
MPGSGNRILPVRVVRYLGRRRRIEARTVSGLPRWVVPKHLKTKAQTGLSWSRIRSLEHSAILCEPWRLISQTLRSGNDLQIDVMGSQSKLTISGWFSSAGDQLQEITADGLKIDSQVSQLVQAIVKAISATVTRDLLLPRFFYLPSGVRTPAQLSRTWK